MSYWDIVRANAFEYYKTDKEFYSLVEHRPYKVIKVLENSIVIARRKGKDAVFGEKSVNAAIKKLRLAGRLGKGELKKSVVRETALIEFHPNIFWNEDSQEIFWDDHNQKLILPNKVKFINSIPDDEFARMIIEVNKRRYQSQFRKFLLHLYDNKCAVSRTNLPEVLEAAHIIPHSDSRINKIENGIILRSDLHALFDKNLLLIHPLNLTVHLCPSILNSPYSKYNGVCINSRIDGTKPDHDYLKEKWNNAGWTVII